MSVLLSVRGALSPDCFASLIHTRFLTAYPEFVTVLSATVFGEGDTFNFMVVYSWFTFGKSARIVPEDFGRQQTPNSCHFGIYTLLHLQNENGKGAWSSIPQFSAFKLQ